MNEPTDRLVKQTPPSPKRWSLSLLGKLSLTFLLVLMVLASVYSYLAVYSANRYSEATYQRLNQNVAAHIAKFARPFIDQRVNRPQAEAIFFNAMVTNPSAEVYLLDSTGTILLYHAPPETIKLDRVSLAPLRKFIQSRGQAYVKGDNPRNPQEQKIFSAANVIRRGRMQGYVYVILGSQEYGSALALLRRDYVLQWGLKAMGVTLLAALAVGLLMLHYQTRNLRDVIQTVSRFSEGDYSARVRVRSTSEVSQLAIAFNQMADRLTATIAELRQSEQVRRDLVATISHDLRTPVAAIHGYAETLAMKPELDEAQVKQYVGVIVQSTKTLMKRVGELFELSKLEASEALPQQEPFVLADLITEVFAKFQLLAQSKNLAFECINCDLPVLCYADVGMIERVIQNLVENAVQYAPVASDIHLKLESKASLVRLSVLNTVPNLPEPVWMYLTGSTSVRPANVGLGLAIVRKILSLHQSRLSVERGPDGSLCFFFELPVLQRSGQLTSERLVFPSSPNSIAASSVLTRGQLALG